MQKLINLDQYRTGASRLLLAVPYLVVMIEIEALELEEWNSKHVDE